MFVIESIHVASESICVYTWLRLSWSLIISCVQRVIRRVSLGMQRGLGVETSFPRKILLDSPISTYRGIKMSLDNLRLRNRSIDRFRFQFIALDSVGSFSFYGANSCSFRSQSFHFVTLSPRLIGGEIVTPRHSRLP